jgi:site-specific DNA recombinase
VNGVKISRCAIYTRKSTEHNLDLEFNSLHAQREACEAYVKSQKHEGWQLIPDSYDDGGISGASLDRPDLQRLLADISAGRVDTVVVYKVDRLTRSLTDFAKLVDLFDKHGVSFVSITQAFNTTTSMGRLTLNVLLSFAQFEREVIGERVRDKIAASKRKGLFMGGNIPMGYINLEKKLVIVPEEADQVRWMFRRYLELGSMGLLLEEMNRLGMRTRTLTLSDGESRGGVSYGKGALAYLLRNRCYVGEIAHRGQIHAGEHEPIIDRETFEAVQASLAAQAITRKASTKASDFLLTGLLFDSAGNRMTPSHSRKKGVRYRYYVSQAILQSRKGQAGEVFRVPAPEIEAEIERFVRLRAPDPHGDIRAMIGARIARITVQTDSISVELTAPEADTGESPAGSAQMVNLSWSRKPFRATKGAIGSAAAVAVTAAEGQAVLAAIGRSRRWVDYIMAGGTLAEIASREGKGERQIRLLIPLAFTPPETLRRLVDGSVSVASVTEMARTVPLAWQYRSGHGYTCNTLNSGNGYKAGIDASG